MLEFVNNKGNNVLISTNFCTTSYLFDLRNFMTKEEEENKLATFFAMMMPNQRTVAL